MLLFIQFGSNVSEWIFPLKNLKICSIVGRLKMRDDAGRICALEFLSLLGVEVRPLDTEGLSTEIMRANEEDLQLRQADHDMR